jgi:hypothetical protein
VISLSIRTPETMAELRRLEATAPLAIARALNRAAASANTVQVRECANDLGLKQADVRKEISVREATAAHLSATLKVKGTRMSLMKFGASGPEPSRGRGRGVTYRLQGQRKRIDHAFLATVRAGSGTTTGVFVRTGAIRKSRGAWSKNLPIVQLYGPSLPHVFAKYAPLALARGEEQLKKNLAHELKWALQQAATT